MEYWVALKNYFKMCPTEMSIIKLLVKKCVKIKYKHLNTVHDKVKFTLA